MWQQTSGPDLVGCYVVPNLSLGSFGLIPKFFFTPPNRWEAQFCRPELVGCYVVSKLWYPNIWKHGRYKSKYPKVLVAMMCPSSISFVSQFPFTDNCRGHSLFVIDYNTPPPPPPSHWFCAVLTFCTPIIFIGDKFSLGLKSLIPDYIS